MEFTRYCGGINGVSRRVHFYCHISHGTDHTESGYITLRKGLELQISLIVFRNGLHDLWLTSKRRSGGV